MLGEGHGSGRPMTYVQGNHEPSVHMIPQGARLEDSRLTLSPSYFVAMSQMPLCHVV